MGATEAGDISLHDKCSQVLSLLDKLDLTFGEFTAAVCYGNPASHQSDEMNQARASLYDTDCFQKVVEKSYEHTDPHASGKRKSAVKPTDGTRVLKEFSVKTTMAIFKSELDSFTLNPPGTSGQVPTGAWLADITPEKMGARAKDSCPNLFRTLAILGNKDPDEEWTPPPPRRGGYDDSEDEDDDRPRRHPHLGIINQIAAIAYRADPKKDAWQNMMAVYMFGQKDKAPIYEMLSECGFSANYASLRRM
ncbi:hypothetical protein RSAG8_07944, partial [Rhizoctonia solani AG-8 WAC10335]